MDATWVVIRSEGVGVSDTVDDPKRYRRALQFDMHLSREDHFAGGFPAAASFAFSAAFLAAA